MAKQKQDEGRVRQLAERLFVETWRPGNAGYHPSKLVKECCEAAKNFYEFVESENAPETNVTN